MDAFTYNYKTDLSGNILNNQLRHVNDGAGATVSSVDVDNQSSDNYAYNAIGQLISDTQEDITSIEWTVTGKVKKMTFGTGDYVEFQYDPFGNRISKKVFDFVSGDITQTFYTHDATGNVIAVYDYTDDGLTETLVLAENHIYGGKRLGVYDRGINLITPPSETTLSRILGDRDYELTNHLGNVLEVISDRLLTIDINTDALTDYYLADVISYCDYTPYGVQMENRNASTSSYRYGFQDQEKDDEIKGEGNSVNYKYRMHDPRIGRFFAVDPVFFQYPFNTPYAFAMNRVIDGIDLEGCEHKRVVHWVEISANGDHVIVRTEVDIDQNATFFDPGGVMQYAITEVYYIYESTGEVYDSQIIKEYVDNTTTIGLDFPAPSAKYDYTKDDNWEKLEDDMEYVYNETPYKYNYGPYGYNNWYTSIVLEFALLARDANAPDNSITMGDLSIAETAFSSVPGIYGGFWVKESTKGWSTFSKKYQEQITGKPTGIAYKVGNTRFDGIRNGVLLDAKGKYEFLLSKGWAQNGLLKEARRQLKAIEGIDGATITWSFAEEGAAKAVIKLFEENGITGINVEFVAPNF